MKEKIYKKYQKGDLVHDLMIKYNEIFKIDINILLKNFFEFIENNYTDEQKKEFTPNEAVAMLVYLIEDFTDYLKKEFDIEKVIFKEEE